MDDKKQDNFTQFYNKNLNLLKVLKAPQNEEVYRAFWNARDPELEDVTLEINRLNAFILEQAEVIQAKDKFIDSFEKTEKVLKSEINSSGQYIHSLNENINLQGIEVEKLNKFIDQQDEVASDLRFVIAEQKSEKGLLSNNIVNSQNHIKELQEQISNYIKRERRVKKELQEISSKTQVIEETSRDQIQFLIEKNEQLQNALDQRDDVIDQSKRYTKEYRSINARLSEELIRMKQKVKKVEREGPAALIDCH